MILLMSGWMLLLMGLLDNEVSIIGAGLILVVFNIWGIRTQFMVSTHQYIIGMIPHHSMAVHMSKKLLEKGTTMSPFVKNIIKTQEVEIDIMKKLQ